MFTLRPADLTISIATYNGENFVARTVASALATGARVVVSDDGSTDGTRSILEQFSPRVELLFQPRTQGNAERSQGIAKQNQLLLDACTTPLMLMLEQDDLVEPKRLLRLNVAPDEVNVLNGWIINGRGARVCPIYRRPPLHLTTRGVFRGLRVEHFIKSPSQVIFAPELARGAGGFLTDAGPTEDSPMDAVPSGDSPGRSAQDWMRWLRLAPTGVSFRLHMRPAIAHRVHTANQSRHHDSHVLSRHALARDLPAPPSTDRRLRIAW
ncbi:MAG TPA: glycosyltransferase [Solirubrobacteraceae bacterium]|nr:glycosyltransferase [Solirubrobacteraceae bacterium]